MKISRILKIAVVLLLLGSQKGFTTPLPAETNSAALDGRWHTIKMEVSPKLPRIHAWQKFDLVWWLENSDEPVPPAWYLPADRHRVMKWHFRNPFHNFSFYVIGVADKPTTRSGRYPDHVSNPHGGWNFAVTRRRMIFLPYISYQHSPLAFYLGWRKRGDFGLKINFSKDNRIHAATPAPQNP